MSSSSSIAEQRDLLQVENRQPALEKDELSAHVGQLAARNSELDSELQDLTRKLALYEEELAWYRTKLYGRGTEQLSEAERLQMRLFDEIETSAAGAPPEEEPEPDTGPARSRRRPRRRPLPQSLPRVERIIDLPEEDQQCACGHRLVRIGEEVAERVDVLPPQVQVLRTVRPKYACHHCEGAGDEQRPAVRIAPAPAALIPKGLASAGLLAYIATAKFCDALPLYRQERQFARFGIELSRRTMADWMIAVAGACAPIMEALLAKLRAGSKLQIDETTVQVHREPGRADTRLSYLWVARGGPPTEPVLVYRYAASRGGWVAGDLIGDYQGYVQTDGYQGYERPCSRSGITHVGCWAHVRRPFKDAADALGKVSSRAGAALEALRWIAKLYRAESELAKLRAADPERFVAERRARVVPVLAELHAWLLRKQSQVLPGSALGHGGRVRVGTVAEADPVSGPRPAYAGQQRLRAGDPTVRSGPQELAVLGQSARGDRERDAVQPDRDRQGERARAVLVSPRAVREVARCAHPGRLRRASANRAKAATRVRAVHRRLHDNVRLDGGRVAKACRFQQPPPTPLTARVRARLRDPAAPVPALPTCQP